LFFPDLFWVGVLFGPPRQGIEQLEVGENSENANLSLWEEDFASSTALQLALSARFADLFSLSWR
jgi:hypothetical protein